jgi:hypothetical protein
MIQSVEMDVQGRTSPDYHLQLTLTNHTPQPLTVYEWYLPWVGTYSLILYAAKANIPGTLIDKLLPVDDPGPATTTIQPGETRTGTIQLTRRFPGFRDALRDRDVVVFWSYQLQPIGAAPLPRTGGVVVFQKSP